MNVIEKPDIKIIKKLKNILKTQSWTMDNWSSRWTKSYTIHCFGEPRCGYFKNKLFMDKVYNCINCQKYYIDNNTHIEIVSWRESIIIYFEYIEGKDRLPDLLKFVEEYKLPIITASQEDYIKYLEDWMAKEKKHLEIEKKFIDKHFKKTNKNKKGE